MKRTKKLLSLLLTVALVLTIAPWSGIVASAYDAPVLNSDGYYEISTADHLYWFAEQVNSGNGNTNGYGYINAVLLNDIVVNEGDLSGYDGVSENNWKEWTPIGNEEYAYSGTFDGAGHTISGLYFNDSTENYVGLFGRYWYQSGKISNIGVVNSYFNGCDYVGAICGEAVRGTIQDCYSLSTVKGNSYVGGICGYNSESTKIKNCYNVGEVTGVTYVGGIVGYSYDGASRVGTIEKSYNSGIIVGDSYVGGISGWGGNIESCYNTGSVSGSGEQIGGICGNLYMGSIKLSYNMGAINGYDDVGGICGYGGDTDITNCYNSGTVVGECGWGAAGGICGWSDDINNAITYCYNIGTVSGGYSGSICGKTTTTTISNCYYISEKSTNVFYDDIPEGIGMNTNNGKDTIADISGRFELKNSSQFASGEVAYLLNKGVIDGTQVWYQNIDNGETFDTAPKFVGGTVYQYYNICPVEEVAYSNTENQKGKMHNFENGICSICGTGTGIKGNYIYKNNVQLKAYQLVEVNGAFYYIGDRHEIIKGRKAYVKEDRINGLTYEDGTPITAGWYEFDEDGKMVILNGVVGNKIYKNNTMLKAYQLVEVDGDIYYIGDRHEIIKGRKAYVSAERLKGLTYSDGTPIAPGYYDFDEDGKMVVLNGVIGNKVYKNNTMLKAYQLVEVDGDIYYIGDRHEIIKGRKAYVKEDRINGLTFADGTPITAGYYEFDENGKMIMLNGVVGNYIYKNNVQFKGCQLVEVDGDFYYIGDNHEIVKNTLTYLNKEKINGLTYADGTPITSGFYGFDEDGKMMI